MRRLSVVALLPLFALLAATRLHAQKNVNEFVSHVAKAWKESDATAIAAAADPRGITVDVDGKRVGSITPRQAAAVLRRVFEDRHTTRVTAGAVKHLPGNSARAYAEIMWERRARGTTQPERIKVFIAVAYTTDAWRITEIRLIQ
jgi:hypothetical protein